LSLLFIECISSDAIDESINATKLTPVFANPS
jgi:hypothetical protein